MLVYKDLRTSQIQNSENVKHVVEAIPGFTRPFSSDVNVIELYCLSSGVPDKPDVADDLLKAQDFGQKSIEFFIKAGLVE